ncbi:MAG: hypothetical protein ACRDOO_16715 [Actinomadura sp.]
MDQHDARPLDSMPVEPLLTRDFEIRPEVVYERLRERHGPVAPIDLLGVRTWLALGYPQVLEILRNDTGIWSKRLDDWRDRTEGRVPPGWPLSPALEVNHVIFQEGERLADLRGAWRAALRPYQDRTQPQAKQLEAVVATCADDLVTLMSEGGGRTGWADLSAQYTRPLPLMVVNHLLGFENSQGDDALMDMWRVLDAGPDSARLSTGCSGPCPIWPPPRWPTPARTSPRTCSPPVPSSPSTSCPAS